MGFPVPRWRKRAAAEMAKLYAVPTVLLVLAYLAMEAVKWLAGQGTSLVLSGVVFAVCILVLWASSRSLR